MADQAPTDFHPDEEVTGVLIAHIGWVRIEPGTFKSSASGEGRWVSFKAVVSPIIGDKQLTEVYMRRSALLATRKYCQ